jgi:hypothetical protein
MSNQTEEEEEEEEDGDSITILLSIQLFVLTQLIWSKNFSFILYFIFYFIILDWFSFLIYKCNL